MLLRSAVFVPVLAANCQTGDDASRDERRFVAAKNKKAREDRKKKEIVRIRRSAQLAAAAAATAVAPSVQPSSWPFVSLFRFALGAASTLPFRVYRFASPLPLLLCWTVRRMANPNQAGGAG